jgi:hypothetical protein
MKGQQGPKGFQLVGEPEPEPGGADPMTFSTFVLSLCASALLHLGVRPAEALGIPSDEPGQINLPACQQAIDMLEMLRTKTRGNLTADEARLLESVLHDLHMRFVATQRAGA